MQLEKFELEQTGGFSPLFLDYLSKKASISPFYSWIRKNYKGSEI
jgi:hypothetical protein